MRTVTQARRARIAPEVRSMKRRIEFRVSLVLPDGASVADARDYVLDAVATMRGCYRPPGGHHADDPGDPMFALDSRSVRVTRLQKARRPPGKSKDQRGGASCVACCAF